MPDPAPPVAEPPVEATVAAAEPADPAASPVDSLAEAFRRHGAPASKERPDRAARRAGPAASEESAEAEPKSAEASKPGDDQTEASAAPDGPDKGPSRRGAAAAIKEKDAEIAELRKQWEAERSEKEQRDRQISELTAKSEATRRSILERIGTDETFERLQQARMKREWLTAEEDDQLDRMLEWRAVAADFWELTDTAYKRGIDAAIRDRAERYGLDRQTALAADAGGLIDHVAERVGATLRAEYAEKVSELETELKGLRPLKAARVPAPTVGGASAPAGDLPADDASPHAWFAAGIRNGTHRRGGGRAARRAS